MHKAILALLFLLTINQMTSIAQMLSSDKKAIKQYEAAAVQLRSNKLDLAAQHLENAVDIDPTFVTAQQQLADIYRKQEKYALAIPHYEAVIQQNPTLTPLSYFGLGESRLFEGDYQHAQQPLEHYLQSSNITKKSKSLVQKYLADIHFALNNQQAASPTPLLPLGPTVNTPNDEYFPQLTAGNLHIIFTRKVENQENFYESYWENENWTEAKQLDGAINSTTFNEGAHCISPDGKYLFFTGCNRPNGLGSCDIYVSKKENNQWSTPHNLGAPVNSKGWEAQPSISADGRTLFFVSNRSGGIGGYDIWKTQLQDDGTWGIPENLGPNINTPYDEGSPYLHPDNQTLYFSSNGWPGFGRKDLFVSKLDETSNWGLPTNLGKPINNHKDQLSMHVSMDGFTTHIASRSQRDDLDIFVIETPSQVRPKEVFYVEATIKDRNTNAPLSAQLRVTDINTGSIVFDDASDIEDGKIIATLPVGEEYALHVFKEGYLFFTQMHNLNSSIPDNSHIDTEIALQPIEIGATVHLENVYFDTDKTELLPKSKTDLMVLADFLKRNPSVEIELSGHTDNVGSKTHNLQLSEGRAKAVYRYLIEQQIAAKRISYVGYGDSKPIANNDSEQGKSQNRRTEVLIVKK